MLKIILKSHELSLFTLIRRDRPISRVVLFKLTYKLWSKPQSEV